MAQQRGGTAPKKQQDEWGKRERKVMRRTHARIVCTRRRGLAHAPAARAAAVLGWCERHQLNIAVLASWACRSMRESILWPVRMRVLAAGTTWSVDGGLFPTRTQQGLLAHSPLNVLFLQPERLPGLLNLVYVAVSVARGVDAFSIRHPLSG